MGCRQKILQLDKNGPGCHETSQGLPTDRSSLSGLSPKNQWNLYKYIDQGSLGCHISRGLPIHIDKNGPGCRKTGHGLPTYKSKSSRLSTTGEFTKRVRGVVVSAVCYTIFTIFLSLYTHTARRHLPNPFREFPCRCTLQHSWCDENGSFSVHSFDKHYLSIQHVLSTVHRYRGFHEKGTQSYL